MKRLGASPGAPFVFLARRRYNKEFTSQMSLARRFGFKFDLHVRQRGEAYFRAGRVHVGTLIDGYASATVTGSEPYDVDLSWSDFDAGFLGNCDCPYSVDRDENCKHIWALVLAVDDKLARGADLGGAGSARDSRQARRSTWKSRLQLDSLDSAELAAAPWPESRQICYVLEPRSEYLAPVVIDLRTRDRKVNGDWGGFKDFKPKLSDIARLPDSVDREVISLLAGGQPGYFYSSYQSDRQLDARFSLPPTLANLVLPKLAASGRLFTTSRERHHPVVPVTDSLEESWRLTLELKPGSHGMRLSGVLQRGVESISLTAPAVMYEAGLFIHDQKLARFDAHDSASLLLSLRREGSLDIPMDEAAEAVSRLAEIAPDALGPLPDELSFERATVPCRPLLRIATSHRYSGDTTLTAELLFDYDNHRVAWNEPGRGIFLSDRRILLLRDVSAERAAVRKLAALEFKRDNSAFGPRASQWSLHPSKLAAAVRTLVPQGWLIEADGQAFRSARRVTLRVSSGIDWFELRGEVDYGDASASLNDILEAIRRKENLVRLSDGAYGLLPEEWLARFAPLAIAGDASGDHLRFTRSQTALLDAMLAALPEASWDETFAVARQRLLHFEGIRPADQPEGFNGQLRDYQREGLAWLRFLREFNFGGCLADDMGLGKTAQVLAYLEERRAAGAGASLVVVPRSLVFNWMREAARFTPALRVMDYSGPQRRQMKIDDADVVLSTYGTLRTDIVELKEREFDTVVLDEAQAIKNATTAAAKAARLLRGKHKLALSGTPIENHLGELWSLFEFLNPGMLGSARAFSDYSAQSAGNDPEGRRVLAHALRPFILRRTKGQVAKELPDHTEQTLYCELSGDQLAFYSKLRDAMRTSLFGQVDSLGLAKSRMHVLEALLRLRQAACHPGLVDPQRKKAGSAKLDLLVDQIAEVVEEGHKALIFSQFTSLLTLVKERLDKQGITYEYLDGQTRDRQERVDRFQTDPACPLFLISLKAGGLGLNLTAAEYVYLLDPWWNPAVEAQAIDRTHRIGQTRQVFAYRLVAKDTVEEKILELQKRKRDLADAIITEDNSVLRNLTRDDLEVLFS